MLPRAQRLRKSREIEAVYRRGRRLTSPSFGLSYRQVPGGEPTRLAVVVSRRVSLRATKRNLYKRRLWAAARKLRPQLPAQGYQLVLTARPAIAQATSQALTLELQALWHRLTPARHA